MRRINYKISEHNGNVFIVRKSTAKSRSKRRKEAAKMSVMCYDSSYVDHIFDLQRKNASSIQNVTGTHSEKLKRLFKRNAIVIALGALRKK